MLPKAWQWLKAYAEAKERLVIGLMSGTSADGIDAALVRLIGSAPRRVETLAFTTLPYPPEVKKAVLQISHNGEVETLCWLNFLLGELFAEATFAVAQKANIPLTAVHLIGSHGQTVRHLPPSKELKSKSKPKVGTLQIGEPAVIALRTGLPVVSHFRAKDIAAGGQGAPLVPLVDWLLLRHPRRNRIALNIGGIANITVMPANATLDQVIAFDTGPGNMLIDGAVRYFSDGKESFDRNGQWARKGAVNKRLLRWLLSHPFLKRTPPKSTGREMFGDAFLRKVLAKSEKWRLSPYDVVATLTAFTAITVADAIRRFVLSTLGRVDELIVSGGGANNPVLMEFLRDQLSGVAVLRSNEFGLDVDAKEAIAFAVLAHCTVLGLTGNVPSATGARFPVILGSVTLP